MPYRRANPVILARICQPASTGAVGQRDRTRARPESGYSAAVSACRGVPGPLAPQPRTGTRQPARRLPARALGGRLRQRRPVVGGTPCAGLRRLGRVGPPLPGHLADHATPPRPTTAPGGRERANLATPPSPRQVRWWLLQEPDGGPADQQAYLARLLRDGPTLQDASALARACGRLLRQRDAPAFDPWLARAERSGIAAFGSCARSMRQDDAAIAAALREPYSNGPTEGNVTRLKLLKRQMYGRAKPDLLRQRVLHRAS